MLIRSMVSMYIESSSDKSIRKQARKANKIYYNNMLMGNLNMLSLKLYKRSWDKLDENSKRIIIVNLLSELMFPNNMYDKVIDVAMRL